MKTIAYLAWFTGACALALAQQNNNAGGATRPSAAVDTKRILGADQEPGNWLTHGRTYSEQRFSPLNAIDTESVQRLGLAWSYDLEMGRGAEATPLVVDGVMYVTSAWSIVHAIDAKTGSQRWVFDPKVDRSVGAKACCDVINRGVAVYGDKVFVGVIDGRLVAVDRQTGTKVWDTVTVDQSLAYTITGAPRAANGLVYIGNGGAEFGVRGYVSAYAADTGALQWRFYTVPGNPARGPDGAASDSVMPWVTKTWNGEWWKGGGGGTVWDAIVYDAELDQLLVGVGNGSPWNHQIRSPGGGDNLFLASIVALNPKTGAYKWHYQTVPGDTWDYTATQPIVLADLEIDGVMRKVAMQAPKNGFFYVLDRTNGKLISAKPYIEMLPAKDTPKDAPLAWAHAIDPASGRPIENPGTRYTTGSTFIYPGPQGAHNWHPMSYSPRTGLVYLPTHRFAIDYAHESTYEHREGFENLGVIISLFPDDPKVRAAIKNSVSGTLIAWDPVNGREVWRAKRRGPWNGGTLAVAGGLVFQGTGDGSFLAMNAKTGQEVWSYDTQAATLAGPVSYQVEGEQHIAVAAGYGTAFFLIEGFFAAKEGAPINARVYSFRIGGTAPKPLIPLHRIPTPKPPVFTTTPADYTKGNGLYDRFCLACHGVAVITGGVLPDLRKTPRLQDGKAWFRALTDGELQSRGMPQFRNHVTEKDAELIRAYVARQAGFLYAEEQTAASSSKAPPP